MSRQQGADAAFPELAANIRQSIDWAKQVGGDPLDPDLLMLLVIELEKKFGGKRPELPPEPQDPRSATLVDIPNGRRSATRSQLQREINLIAELKQAKLSRGRATSDEARRIASERVEQLRIELDDVEFEILIAGLPASKQQHLRSERGSPAERQQTLTAYRLRLARYEQEAGEMRRAIAEWDTRHGSNPVEHATRLRIFDRLRADAEAYARGDFRVPLGKVAWRILPPGHWGAHEIAAIHAGIRSRNPGIQLDEARLPYADGLGPRMKYVGEDEFDGYFVFLFERTERVLLENPIEGNAAYIFSADWT